MTSGRDGPAPSLSWRPPLRQCGGRRGMEVPVPISPGAYPTDANAAAAFADSTAIDEARFPPSEQ